MRTLSQTTLKQDILMWFYMLIDWGKVQTKVHNINTSRKGVKEEVKTIQVYFFRNQIGTCYHMIALWLILGKNVWTDNASAHGCKKQHHLRTRGKDEILGRNNITWSLYDSLLIMKSYKDDNIWLVIWKFGKNKP